MSGRFLTVTPFLAAHDLSGSLAFYRDVLGFECELLFPEPPQTPTLLILRKDETTIMFDAALWREQNGGTPLLTGALRFDLGKVAGFGTAALAQGGMRGSAVMSILSKIKAAGAPILWGPEVYFYGRREFSCADPNGYALIFSEETDEPATDAG